MKVKSKTPIAPYFEDSQGGKYQVAYFSGYNFGDRQLEGVNFKAELLPDGHLEVSTVMDWNTDRYLRTLNVGYWMPLALGFAERNDLFQITESGKEDTDELSFAEFPEK